MPRDIQVCQNAVLEMMSGDGMIYIYVPVERLRGLGQLCDDNGASALLFPIFPGFLSTGKLTRRIGSETHFLYPRKHWYPTTLAIAL